MREIYWDYAKGIAIVAVVIIHSTAYLLQSSEILQYLGLAVRQIVNFAVPVFLFIAGYFSISNNKTSNQQYIKSRIARILPPYLFWSVVFFLIPIILFKENFELLKLFEGILFGTSIGIGYFVIVLIQFVFITLFLKNIYGKKVHIFLMLFFTTIGFLYTYLSKIYLPNDVISSFPYSALPFFVWYPFYHLGLYLSKYKPNINTSNSASALLLLLSFCFVESYILKEFVSIEFAASQIKISSYVLSFYICLLIYQNRYRKDCNKSVVFLGVNSYGIYLTHVLFIGFSQKFLSGLWMNTNIEAFGFIFLSIISLVLSVITVLSVKFLTGKTLSKYIVG